MLCRLFLITPIFVPGMNSHGEDAKNIADEVLKRLENANPSPSHWFAAMRYYIETMHLNDAQLRQIDGNVSQQRQFRHGNILPKSWF